MFGVEKKYVLDKIERKLQRDFKCFRICLKCIFRQRRRRSCMMRAVLPYVITAPVQACVCVCVDTMIYARTIVKFVFLTLANIRFAYIALLGEQVDFCHTSVRDYSRGIAQIYPHS